MKAKNGIIKKAVCLSCAALLLAVLIALSCVVGTFDGSLSFYFGKSQLDSATRETGEALATQIEEEGIVMVKNDDDCLPLSQSDVTSDGELRVNVFGWASTDWLMGGSGSGRSTNEGGLKPNTDLLKALAGYDVFSDAGIAYNAELTNMYTKFKNGRNSASTDTLHSYASDSCVLWEPDFATYYTDAIKQNAAQYSDVALVVLGRISGESNDAPMTQYRYSLGTSASNKVTDDTRTYMDVSPDEEDLLKYVGANFDKVIVIINSTNQMNLEFMDRIDGLDSCLVVGGTGNNAANAIPNVLFGLKKSAVTDADGEAVKDSDGNVKYEIVECSPSGKTVDTYAYNFNTNPNWFYSAEKGISAYQNVTGVKNSAGNALYPLYTEGNKGNVNLTANGSVPYTQVSYLDYIEGIYVGYKWYETADAEGFWNNVDNEYGKGYDGVVQYPFGYGLSYTEFEWTVNWLPEKDGKISVQVTVTNTGDYAGQDVVELYYTPFYNENSGIEKAAVNLCAFAKTEVLLPESVDESKSYQTLTLTFDVQDMASYDQNEDDGAYVLEKGDYTISLRTDSHTVKTVKSGGATHKYTNSKNEVYNTYAGSNGENEISNLFIGENNSDKIAIDGSNTNQNINWLSRKNGFANFPEQKAADRSWQESLTSTNVFTKADADAWDAAWSAANGEQDWSSQGTDNGIRLANVKQTKKNNFTIYVYDYDDKNGTYKDAFTDEIYFFGNPDNFDSYAWDELLDQLSWTEIQDLVTHGYIHEEGLASIGKPATISLDGPSQYGSFNASSYAGIGYPNPTVLAQTWNDQLSTSFGMAVANEIHTVGGDGWYAPGVNLHRSAFGGRNYEYYSEDPYLSGLMCANTVRGALDMGVYTYIKHLIGYDQESARDSLYCWMTEQALRENYLRPFKMAIDKGATGLMTSYGRIGAIWSGGSQSLITDLLRNEWGYKGAVLTDYSDHQDFMNGDQMLRAGGDLWMDGWTNGATNGTGGAGNLGVYGSTTSDAYRYQARLAAKHVIYMWANSAYEAQAFIDNGGDEYVIERTSAKVFKWWWIIVAVADAGCAAGAGTLVYFGLFKKNKNKPEDEVVTSEPAI